MLGIRLGWQRNLFFSPYAISPLCWYDASDSLQIVLNNSKIIQWQDKSINKHHLIQVDVTLAPTLTSLNNKNAILFNDSFFSLVNEINTVKSGFYVVNKINGSNNRIGTNAPTNSDICPIHGQNNYGSVNQDHNFLRYLSDYNISIDGSTDYAGKASSNGADPVIGENINLGLSATNLQNETNLIYYDYEFFPRSAKFQLVGKFFGGSNTHTAKNSTFAELIFLSFIPDTSTRQKIEGYLAHKWNLVAKLPTNHPFKTQHPKLT